jgi:sulfite exporter TauE/SafE
MELIAAFTLGLFGSLHCVGMCGPLMLAANSSSGGGWRAPFTYQAGRLTTYLVLGGLLGGLGLGLRLWNAQSAVAIFSGLLLIVFAVMQWDPGKMLTRWPAYARFQFSLRSKMAAFIGKRGLSAQYTLGACNGLVPCGLVYLAVIGAANTGSPLSGSAFMLAFGMGTLPLLSASLYAGRKLLTFRPDTLNRWTPAIMLVSAILLIWRGWNAHVPGAFFNYQDMAFPPLCH